MAVLESIHSSSDIDLGIAAFEKSFAERDRGVLLGPFEVGEDLAIGYACLRPTSRHLGAQRGWYRTVLQSHR